VPGISNRGLLTRIHLKVENGSKRSTQTLSKLSQSRMVPQYLSKEEEGKPWLEGKTLTRPGLHYAKGNES
jgi:hypothetical protein